MSHRFFLLLAAGALLTGCAYGVGDADDHEAGSTGEASEALEVATPASATAADGTSREPSKPQPDPWGGRVAGRRDTPTEVGVDPGKPQPDPWHSSTPTTTSTTNSK